MQKYKKAALNIALLTLLLSGGMSLGYVRADVDSSDKNVSKQEEMLLDSFENDDYNSWKKVVSKKSKIHEMVSVDDFEKFVVARKLARAGEYDKAIELTEKLELDLKTRLGEIFI